MKYVSIHCLCYWRGFQLTEVEILGRQKLQMGFQMHGGGGEVSVPLTPMPFRGQLYFKSR